MTDTVRPEVGKRYVMRNGGLTNTIYSRSDDNPCYPFCDGLETWTKNGECVYTLRHDHDLVSEYKEEDVKSTREEQLEDILSRILNDGDKSYVYPTLKNEAKEILGPTEEEKAEEEYNDLVDNLWKVLNPIFKWLAIDADRHFYAFTSKPSVEYDFWTGDGEVRLSHFVALPKNIDWRTSLRERPITDD